MTLWHVLGLMLCLGLSYGVNELTRPRFEYAMGASERMEVTGALKLNIDGTAHALDLATIQVVNGSAPRLWGSPLRVRELWIRSAELEAQSDPDLELFVDLEPVASVLENNARSLDPIVGRSLPVLAVARGNRLRSRMRLPAATTHATVEQGSFTIRHATPLPGAQGSATFRVQGELSLTLREGSAQRTVAGNFEAPTLWY